jgi:hypothetical protein
MLRHFVRLALPLLEAEPSRSVEIRGSRSSAGTAAAPLLPIVCSKERAGVTDHPALPTAC